MIGGTRVLPMIAVLLVHAIGANPSQAASNVPPGPVFLAQAPAPQTNVPVSVEVTTGCEEGEPVFTIVNRGEPWPAVGKVVVFRINDRSILVQRNMRMTANQRASFRAKGGGAGIEVGLWIEPTWYQRPVAYDARTTCQ